LLEIPYDKKIAEYYSEGVPFVNAIPAWKSRFTEMIDGIRREL